jgi:hypothetical protein
MKKALMGEIRLLWAWASAVSATAAARLSVDAEDNDRGEIVQTVVIIAAFVAAAIIIVAILVGKATDSANSVKTN